MALCRTLLVVSLGGALLSCSSKPLEQDEVDELTYPNTLKSDQTDDYHGTKVADPYRWLEDTDSEQTTAWIEAQNKVTFEWLARISQRGPIRDRLEKLWDHERFGVPRKRGDRYFYTRNDGLQNQSVLYVADSLDGEARVLLDPNELSDDGTVHMTDWNPSDDGKLLAYGLASAGSDWKEYRVLDVESGQQLLDHIEWVKFSGLSWLPDGSGFFYSRYDEPQEGDEFTGQNYYQKLYFHPMGEPQYKDQLVYERTDEKEWGFDGEVTEDGRYLIISVWRGTERKNQVFYKDLKAENGQVVELVSGFEARYVFLGNDESDFWFRTDLDAPLQRVVSIDTSSPKRDNWREIVPESKHLLDEASIVGDQLFASYLEDARSVVKYFDFNGKEGGEVELPTIGTVGGFNGRRSDSETFFWFTSFIAPPTIYRFDLESDKSDVFRKPDVDFDPDKFEVNQVFYESKGGTKVPMFLVHQKGLDKTGDHPTILYGYGGFDIPVTPSFKVQMTVWMENGGVFASANLRGGGEYGREWHEAGMRDNKQNVFDDFIAAAEWLIANKDTSKEKLAIEGRSNGGLLVGAAMTQRPDLFAAAVPGVGVMDMLRYHKFTIGWAWVNEYGSADEPDEFHWLYEYSPLHNLETTRYPATLITTGDHDDRVVPGHSFKFAAQLQAVQSDDGPPTLIRIDTSAGHGAGKPTSKLIDESADVLAFLAHVLDLEVEPRK